VSARTQIIVALGVATLCFLATSFAALRRSARSAAGTARTLLPAPSIPQLLTGFVTNFFDTLGIGSFATTTTLFKLTQMVPDEQLPGTLNVGHTLPTILQAILYISLVEVDPATLVLLMVAAVSGAWWGAGIVARLPRRVVQQGVGSALVASIAFLTMAALHLFPAGGTSLSLEGIRLLVAILGCCLFGALGSLGVGFYAPCMILVSLLGMAPLAAFPIMMCSSAFLLPAASARFFARNSFDARAAAGLALGGLPAVLMAALVVKSLPLGALRWLVIAAASCAALLLFRSAARESRFVSPASPSSSPGSLS
jgi:uncharacterized membrane protein YfcA